MKFVEKRKYTLWVTIMCLSLGVGSTNVNSQEVTMETVEEIEERERKEILHLLPIYNGFQLKVPHFKMEGVEGEECSLYSGTLELNWDTKKFEVKEYNEIPLGVAQGQECEDAMVEVIKDENEIKNHEKNLIDNAIEEMMNMYDD